MSDRPPRRLGYTAICLTCDNIIAHDERAVVEQGVGAWHEDCAEPLNLTLYRRERDRDSFTRIERKPPQRRSR